jgi:hypothetical protein
MTLQEAIAKIVPKLRENIIRNLNGSNNRKLTRRQALKTDYLKRNPTYWKYPQPQSRTLLNSVKVVQLRNTIVVKTVKYGLYLETGTKYIKPARPWFKDAFTQTIKRDLAKELKKAFIDQIKASLR